MGRTRRSQFIYFNATKYIQDLRKEIKEVTTRLGNEIRDIARDNLQKIPFKDNPVRLGDGTYTSDLDRKSAVLDSIVRDRVSWQGQNVIRATVRALEGDFKDTHIGLYYEHGTGTGYEPPKAGSFLPSVNDMYRNYLGGLGKPIVTRSKFINGGRWKDLGGNTRLTFSPRAGDRDEGFVSYVGDDLEAQHWFEDAFNKVREKALKEYKEAIKRVPITNYITVKRRIILGRDGVTR